MNSKITQNYENMVTRNQENPRKKTSRNGTVAGYARSALDKGALRHRDRISMEHYGLPAGAYLPKVTPLPPFSTHSIPSHLGELCLGPGHE